MLKDKGVYALMKKLDRPIKSENGYIILNKQKIIDYFFYVVLCVGVLFFLFTFIRGALNINSNSGIRSELISYYHDDYLNIQYPIPGGNWVMAELDLTGVDEVIKESYGEDKFFNISDDSLSEELLSLVCFNESGVEGYRQFMSFTFKPDNENNYSNDDEFIDYCVASLQRDLDNSETNGEPADTTLLSAVMDDTGGVLVKMLVQESFTTENDDGTTTSYTEPVYYTQYITDLGANLGTVIFGSITEDNTVDQYLQYFMNNIIADDISTITNVTSNGSSENSETIIDGSSPIIINPDGATSTDDETNTNDENADVESTNSESTDSETTDNESTESVISSDNSISAEIEN